MNWFSTRSSAQPLADSRSSQFYIINYTVDGTRFEKLPDSHDHDKNEAATHALRTCALPLVKLIPGKETQRNGPRGIEYLHQFFTEREHAYLARLIQNARQISDRRLALGILFAITATMPYASRMRRFRADRKGGGPLSGTLYVGSLITPPHVGKSFLRNATTIADGLSRPIDPSGRVLVTTQSSTDLKLIPDGCVDYIFTDPPFGHNFDYSELNFFWEAMLRVTTNQEKEAIVR